MKKILKILLFLITPIILYILLSFFLLLFPTNSKCKAKNKTIYLYTDNIHSEIIIPANYIKREKLSFRLPRKLGYFAFSYGDREFMMNVPTWNDIDINIALKALFLNTPALIRVCYYSDIKKDLCTEIKLSKDCLDRLKNSIFNSFVKRDEHFVRYKDHYKIANIFYFQAKKSYNLFHTCNSWTGDRLREAGLKASYLTPFAMQVIYPYQKKE